MQKLLRLRIMFAKALFSTRTREQGQPRFPSLLHPKLMKMSAGLSAKEEQEIQKGRKPLLILFSMGASDFYFLRASSEKDMETEKSGLEIFYIPTLSLQSEVAFSKRM